MSRPPAKRVLVRPRLAEADEARETKSDSSSSSGEFTRASVPSLGLEASVGVDGTETKSNETKSTGETMNRAKTNELELDQRRTLAKAFLARAYEVRTAERKMSDAEYRKYSEDWIFYHLGPGHNSDASGPSRIEQRSQQGRGRGGRGGRGGGARGRGRGGRGRGRGGRGADRDDDDMDQDPDAWNPEQALYA